MSARRGPGRPRLPKSERKGAIFSVRLSPKERSRVEAEADRLGVKASEWARRTLLQALPQTVRVVIKKG